MGKIFELTGNDIDDIVRDIVEENEEIRGWCQEDEYIKKELENIFYIRNVEGIGKEFENDIYGYYGIGTRANMYRKDSRKHICAKDMVIDFIKIIFSPDVWNVIKKGYCAIKGIPCESFTYADGYIIISKIKNAIVNNVVNLDDKSFCFYLQMVSHFREHGKMTLTEIDEWLPETGEECSWQATDWECQFCENDRCMLKGKEKHTDIIRKQLNEMVSNRILLTVLNENDTFKINY